MSWNGTVRCSYCGQKGHNKLGCPERAKNARENPDSYEGRRWHAEQRARKAQIANRVCSYCKKPNHNRRGCPVLKEDIRLVNQRQSEYVLNFAEATASAGLSPGALLKLPEGPRENPWSKYTVAMITKINWNEVDFLLQDEEQPSWGRRNRNLFSARVVSTHGYEETSSYWRRAPSFNDVTGVSTEVLHRALSDVLSPEPNPDYSSAPAEVIGVSHRRVEYPDPSQQSTQYLVNTFHFDPDKRADQYDKERRDMQNSFCEKVRPKEYILNQQGAHDHA